MSKYTIVGFLSLAVGIFQIFLSLTTLFVTIPRAVKLYEEFSASFDLSGTYVALIVLAFIGISEVFLGARLFSKAEAVRKKTFRYALALLALSFFAGGLFWVVLISGVVLPIYELKSQF